MTVRRANALVGTWDGDEFVLQNYITGGAASTSPAVAHALSAFAAFTSMKLVAARLGGDAVGSAVARALLDADILVARGTEVERFDATVASTWAWGNDARFFHFSARRTHFRDDFAAEHADLAALARVTPPPPAFASLRGEAVTLPRTEPRGSFWEALRERRTCRKFARRNIGRRALATILDWTWGARRVIEDPEVGKYLLKTSPSGGARHPTEVYVFVQRVAGI